MPKTSLFKPEPIHLAGPIPNGFTLPAFNLPVTPTADDLAATEDIVLTPAIRALAASLNNNPVQIYNWVRNNIEYLPTYGSIQGADMTLQTKRGNSFDTASLLIGASQACAPTFAGSRKSWVKACKPPRRACLTWAWPVPP